MIVTKYNHIFRLLDMKSIIWFKICQIFSIKWKIMSHTKFHGKWAVEVVLQIYKYYLNSNKMFILDLAWRVQGISLSSSKILDALCINQMNVVLMWSSWLGHVEPSLVSIRCCLSLVLGPSSGTSTQFGFCKTFPKLKTIIFHLRTQRRKHHMDSLIPSANHTLISRLG